MEILTEKESDCQYARYTNIQWNFTDYPESRNKCRIVKCRHPDAVKAGRLYKESDGKIKELGIFQTQGVEGLQFPNDHFVKATGEECLYRRSRFCNSSCPGYKAFVLEDSSSAETEAVE